MSESPAQTRDVLLDAAEQLFSAKGYAAVGIRDIADLAHANIASIKYHFGSKSELYLETVRRAMSRSETEALWDPVRQVPPDRTAAAGAIARFVHTFLWKKLASQDTDACCNLMLHEASEPTEAIDAVIRDYVGPNLGLLANVIQVITPTSDPQQLSMFAQSILGQVMHYRVFRPFMERMQKGDLSDPARISELATHIAGFSLRALGCPESLIAKAISEAAMEVAAAIEGSVK